ncbi:VOC family protein [Collimonas pratensis]|uniref:VOC family protein n=1 Tax=Collimonas pratensis TaxID=279113 RepID=UPI00143D5834|nr:VOC family protein [Collimonas pratensis]NKI70002.1 VOC family protein [Collimonas pratensis]
MLHTCIDHLVITAPSLMDGAEYVRQALGVRLEAGGEHPRMGTHNSLLRLGDGLFLEMIAVNPEAPPPDRPRWFQLDAAGQNVQPRLATWVARTNNIHAAVAASPLAHGEIQPMTRGQLHWLITIPADGGLPLQGAAPTLIEWQAQPHPASKLPDLGCSLLGLEANLELAAAEQLSSMLALTGFQGAFSVNVVSAGLPCGLVAHIQTPTGLCRLGLPAGVIAV